MRGRPPRDPRDGGTGTGRRPPAGPDRAPRRLRWALRAYPRDVRATQGDVLLSLARDILDEGGSSIRREALGLLRGGLEVRAGALARAPWEPALRRAALWIAGGLLALVCGAGSWWSHAPAWPGWSWIAVLTAPALVFAGHVRGRRAPVAAGALLAVALGIAQANGLLPALALKGSIEWGLRANGWEAEAGRSLDLPLAACGLPGAVVLLASAAHARPPLPRRAAVATVAWLVAGAAGAVLTVEHVASAGPTGSVTLGGIRFDGLGLCMAAAGVAAMAALAVGFARRRRDPAGMLAGVVLAAAVLPVVSLYGLSTASLTDGQGFLALGAVVVAMVAGFASVVRRVGPDPSRV